MVRRYKLLQCSLHSTAVCNHSSLDSMWLGRHLTGAFNGGAGQTVCNINNKLLPLPQHYVRDCITCTITWITGFNGNQRVTSYNCSW